MSIVLVSLSLTCVSVFFAAQLMRPMRVKIRLIIKDAKQKIKDVREQSLYGRNALMTDNGTFVINGTDV